MEIQSSILGTLQVAEQEIYEVPQGLYGLEDFRQYVLVRPDTSLPFSYLQSVDEPTICLLMADPFAFYKDYEFDLSEQDLLVLGQPSMETVAVWVTVSGGESIQEATINLLAPLIFNTEKKIGRQVVLHNTKHSTRVPLFVQKKEGE